MTAATKTSDAKPSSASTSKPQVTKVEPPRGKPVSGRPWKTVQKARFSSVKYKATKELSSTWDAKMKMKAKKKELQELQNEIKQRRRKEIEDKKKEKEEREKRRMANEFKTAQVQVITKTHKIKGMSKKQLRKIKKTRMSKNGEVEYVGLYDKQ